LLWIAINEEDCKQMSFLDATEMILAKMFEHTKGQIMTIGTFEGKQKNFLEVSVLLMHPSVSL
jgi:NADP-dependent 3-hydroxy acid dehydrogenase YdfG